MIGHLMAWVHERTALRAAATTVTRTLRALVSAGLVLATVAGCAQYPARDRDLNLEAIQQMGYWGNDPGF
jgi:hypothetical protein